MATRSTISIKEGNKIKTIYCHWDGYPSNNGAILLQHYSDPNKVNQLINLGDISSLRENVEPTNTTTPHSFDKPHDDVVVAYMRDRGEKDCEAREYDKPSEKQQYNYLFENGKWYLISKDNSLTELTNELCEIED